MTLASAPVAGLVVGLAVWDVTRTLGEKREDPEIVEGGLVFAPAGALATVLVAAVLNPPTATVGGLTVEPSLRMAVEWAFNAGVYAAIATAGVVTLAEGILLATDRIAPETTLLRFLTEQTHE